MLSNISPQNNPASEMSKIQDSVPPPPKIMPPEKAIKQMDLALSNDYRSLKSLQHMIRINPEKVIPRGDSHRLLREVTLKIRTMKEKSLSPIFKHKGISKNLIFLLFEEGKIDQTLGESLNPVDN